MSTFFRHRFAQVHLVHRFLWSTVAHWFLLCFSWLVAFSVGGSCQKGCIIVDRSKSPCLPLASDKTSRACTNAQHQENLPKKWETQADKYVEKIFADSVSWTWVLVSWCDLTHLNHKRNCYHCRRSPSCHNAAGCDEIRPEMFKGVNREVLWLTRVC